MAEGGRGRPRVYTIAAHRGFADALVAALIPRYAEPGFGLARLTILLPSRRTARAVTEAFVRASGEGGLLLPRMATVGDLDLDEALGALFDPLGAGAAIPPAADPTERWLRLAAMIGEELVEKAPPAPARLRLARSLAASLDRLSIEDVAPGDLFAPAVLDLLPDLAAHWQESLHLFLRVQERWQAELEERGQVAAPVRRNRLLDHAARAWRDRPPPHPIVAAGVTSAAPAVARLLRTVAELPGGAVILPDLDLALDSGVWDKLGRAGGATQSGEAAFGRDDAMTHPQYHLKLLLNRMGIARDEVRPWHRSGPGAAPPERSRAISSLFLPAEASADWFTLPAERRRLSGVRLMESATPEEEAQALAILIREALEEPERRVALVTPDRSLAARVIAHLGRWGIVADDSAGRPLAETPAGRLMLGLADCLAERFAPVPLLGVLGHPLATGGGGRAAWLDQVRQLDLALRGPRPAPGLLGIAARVEDRAKASPRLPRWWAGTAAILAPLDQAADGEWPLVDLLTLLAGVGEALCGVALWAQPDGRALAGLVETLGPAAARAGTQVEPGDLPAVLREAMAAVAVRPPWGGHPRLAVYGLLEARMQRADLVLCGAMHEGSWPAAPAPDPLLAPAVLRVLGIPGAEFRIGLAAHDLAAALGAPEVVLSHAARSAEGPVIPSRFLLRIRAMLGELGERHRETRAVALARAIDRADPAPITPRPQPRPSPEQRRVAISATALDRLRSDPYQFYASHILRLRPLDPLDADPSAAIKGTTAHEILESWHKAGSRSGELREIARAKLAAMAAHPFVRASWEPRLLRALEWVEARCGDLAAQGRLPAAAECSGRMEVSGVTITGKADRLDVLSDGRLAVVDYKTGAPPRGSQVAAGYALQLGVLGLIAQAGGFEGAAGTPDRFEYWSLARHDASPTGFGWSTEPIPEEGRRSGIPRSEFLSETARMLNEAIEHWIVGDAPFTARLNPDLPVYADYDQLMRLDEWQARSDPAQMGAIAP